MAETKPKAPTFAARLADARSAMPNPVKDTKAYNYKYETLDQVLAIVQPALMERGMLVQQGVCHDTAMGWYLRTVIYDTTDAKPYPVDIRPVQFGDDQQKNGSYETYARRYALKTVFGLCGEDDDGAKTAQKPAKGNGAGAVSRKTETAHQTAPESPKGRFAEYNRLKKMAVQLGASKDGLDAWQRANVSDLPTSELTDEQVAECCAHFQTIIDDETALRAKAAHYE